jgi:hypothetical protein
MAGPWEKYQRGGGVMLPPAPKAQYEAPQAAADLENTRTRTAAINRGNAVEERKANLAERQFAAQQAQLAAKRKKEMAAKKGVVMSLAEDILTMRRIRNDIKDSWFTPGFGEVGAFAEKLKGIPGTAARDIDSQFGALKSSFARSGLSTMRQESPTGGAVGNPSDKDLAMLETSRGPVDQGLKYPDFVRNLDNLERRTWNELKRVSPAAERRFRERFDGKSGGNAAPARSPKQSGSAFLGFED